MEYALRLEDIAPEKYVLARDVYDNHSTLLMRQDKVITETNKKSFRKYGIDSLVVTKKKEEVKSKKARAELRSKLASALVTLQLYLTKPTFKDAVKGVGMRLRPTQHYERSAKNYTPQKYV